MFLWALESSKKNAVTQFVVVWVKRLLSFQLAVLAMMQVAPILVWTEDRPSLYRALFISGLMFDYDLPAY